MHLIILVPFGLVNDQLQQKAAQKISNELNGHLTAEAIRKFRAQAHIDVFATKHVGNQVRFQVVEPAPAELQSGAMRCAHRAARHFFKVVEGVAVAPLQ